MSDLTTELLDALRVMGHCLDRHVGDCPTCTDAIDRTLERLELVMTVEVNQALAPEAEAVA